jgi:hypothetical protein
MSGALVCAPSREEGFIIILLMAGSWSVAKS